MLTHLDRFAGEIRGAAGTTVFFAVYERRRAAAAVRLRRAPAARGAARAGRTERLDGRTRRAAGDRAGRRPAPVGVGRRSRPSDLLVVYTDGLVERRDESIDVGIDRLAACARRAGDQPIEELADALLERLDPAGRRDDTAVVCARVPSPRSPHRTVRVPAEPARLAGSDASCGPGSPTTRSTTR